jgi:hypothetical protein
MFTPWLTRLFGKTTRTPRRQRRAARPATRAAFRPRLEALEDRTLLSVSTISIASSGTQMGNASSSTAPGSVSANGQYDVFVSGATNLVNGVTIVPFTGNHIYLRNASTGTTSLVDVATSGTTSGDQGAGSPAITPDGRYVAFLSGSDNLTNNDQNPSRSEVYVRDLLAGQTFLVSLGIDGKPANNQMDGTLSIAADGQGHLFLAYQTKATNLTQGDRNSNNDQVFVTAFNLDAGGNIQYGSLNTTLVSADNTSTGNGSNGDSLSSILSQDGSTLVFTSQATNLNIPGGYSDNIPRFSNLYLYSLAGKTLTLLSAEPTPSTAATGNQRSFLDLGYGGLQQAISDDGRYTVFDSNSDNMIPGIVTNGERNVYFRDLVSGATSLVSISSDGQSGANGTSVWPFMTPDGRYVAFGSDASNLAGTTYGRRQIFVRDMQQGQTYMVSLGIDGQPGNGGFYPVLSIAETSDGRLAIAYATNSTNLTANDTSTAQNVFVTTFNLDASGNILSSTRTTTLASPTGSGNGGNDDSNYPILSKDGSTLAFMSRASNLVGETPDSNHWQLFTYNLAAGTLTQVSPAAPSGQTTDTSYLESVSDNGQYLAYVYENHNTGLHEVLAWNAATGTNTVIFTGQGDPLPIAYDTIISGDGSTIAIRAGNVYGRASIYAASNWQSGNPTIKQVSPSLAGNVWSNQSPRISDDGKIITYQLTPNDGRIPKQVYVYNNGVITEVTLATTGNDSNGDADTPLVSADGSTIVFNSNASNLVAGMIDFVSGQSNVYAYSVASKTISLASAQGPGVYTTDEHIRSIGLSDSGQYVVFQSSANDLLGNLSGSDNVYTEDVLAGIPALISANWAGQDPVYDGGSFSPVISGDGSTVAFQSTRSDLIAGKNIGGWQIYSRNWLAASPHTTLVSVNSAGNGGANDYTENPSISDNGSVIAFDSPATNLVSNDPNSNHYTQIFVRNLGSNTTTLASVNSTGTDGGNNNSNTAVLSGDGSTLLFNSQAADLVSGVSVSPNTANVYAFSPVPGAGGVSLSISAPMQPATSPASSATGLVKSYSTNTAGGAQDGTDPIGFLDDKVHGAVSSDHSLFAEVDRLFSDELGLLANLALALDPLAVPLLALTE